MSIAVAGGQAFHLLDAAEALRNQNAAVVSYMPSTSRWAMAMPELAAKVAIRHFPERLASYVDSIAVAKYGRWLAKHYHDDADTLLVLSSYGAEVFSRPLVCRKVCDRGSTHIDFQLAILGSDPRGCSAYAGRHRHRELADYRQSDLILVPSTFAAGTFYSRGFDENRVRVVPYGIEQPEVTFERPALDRTLRLVFAGEPSFRKGFDLLVDAVKLSKRPCEVVVAGHLTASARRHLPERPGLVWRAEGVLRRDTLDAVLGNSHALILPSREEGLPRTALRALTIGTRVVSTEAAGLAELEVTKPLTNIIEGTAESLATALEWLDPAPSKCQETAVQRCRRFFSLAAYGARLLQALK